MICRPRALVVEPAEPVHPPERQSVGRPPVLIALHRKAGVVAGIDFGKRHLRVAISDLSHQLLAERRQPLADDLPAQEAIALAQEQFRDALEEAEVHGGELLGIGMGLPGPVHRPSGQLGNSTILPGWVGINAAEAVAEALGHRVEVGNDANLGALGEWMWGSGRGVDHMAYVKAATGIGAGFIVNGQPYVGAGGTAGELGHTVVDPGGPICRCGNRGCLETLAAGPAVLSSLRCSRRSPDVAGGGRAGVARRRGLRGRSRTREPRSARPSRPSATSSIRAGSWSAGISGMRASCCSSRCAIPAPWRHPVGGRGRPGRRGRIGRAGRGPGRRRPCSRSSHGLTPVHLGGDTSNSQIVASLRFRLEKGRTHMKFRALGAVAVAATLAFSVAACGDDEPTTSGGGGGGEATQEATKAKVGVILPDAASSARWETADRKFLGEAFEAAGVESDIQNANGDKAKFATIADQMLNAGANVLLIVNLDSPSAAAVINKAKQQGVPVIDYDRLTLGGGASYYVSFDNVAVGTAIGSGLVKCMQDNGKTSGPVALLNGSPTDNNATLFKQGYEKAITDGGYSVAADQSVPDWTTRRPARSSSRCSPRPRATSWASRPPMTASVAPSPPSSSAKAPRRSRPRVRTPRTKACSACCSAPSA